MTHVKQMTQCLSLHCSAAMATFEATATEMSASPLMSFQTHDGNAKIWSLVCLFTYCQLLPLRGKLEDIDSTSYETTCTILDVARETKQKARNKGHEKWDNLAKSNGGYSQSFTKTSAVWLVEFSCATVTKSLKEAEADPTWVQSTIATTYGTCWYV